MTQQQIATELFESARKLGNSNDKRSNFIKLPTIINSLSKDIATLKYKPSGFCPLNKTMDIVHFYKTNWYYSNLHQNHYNLLIWFYIS